MQIALGNHGCRSPEGCAACRLEAQERGHGERDRGGRVSQGRGWEKRWGRGRMGGTGQRETGKEWMPAPEWQKCGYNGGVRDVACRCGPGPRRELRLRLLRTNWNPGPGAGGRRGWGAVGGARRPSRSPQVDAVRSRPREASAESGRRPLRAPLPSPPASPLPSPARVHAGKPPSG